MATSPFIRRATTSLVAMFMSSIRLARGGAQAELEARLATIAAREEIRSLLTSLTRLVDEALISGLSQLEPRLHAGFTMHVVDVAGAERRFLGARALVEGYAPLMASGRGNLIWSAVAVDVEGGRATASFKLAGAVKSSPELGLPAGQRFLLVSANTVELVREGEVWKLASIELVHSMAYPGAEQGMSAPRPRQAVSSQQEMAPKASKTRSRAKKSTKKSA